MIYAPFDQFWFLYALLAIFLIIPLLEIITLNDGLIFCLLLTLKFVPSIFNLHIPLPFFEWFMAYALYFYAGTLIARYAQEALTNPKLITLGALIYIPFNYLYFSHSPLNWELGNPGLISNIAASAGLAYTGILFALFIVQRMIMPLAWPKAFFNTLGTYSFEIYLLHTLPSVAIRIILEKVFHIHDLGFHLVLAVALGILIPVLIGKWVSQHNGFDFMFFPGKYLKLTPQKKIKLEVQHLPIG